MVLVRNIHPYIVKILDIVTLKSYIIFTIPETWRLKLNKTKEKNRFCAGVDSINWGLTTDQSC